MLSQYIYIYRTFAKKLPTKIALLGQLLSKIQVRLLQFDFVIGVKPNCILQSAVSLQSPENGRCVLLMTWIAKPSMHN